jgi:glycosyltransferase involved in cell wall biosynthesis
MDSWVVGIILKYLVRGRVVFDVHEYYPARVAEAAPEGFFKRLIENMVRNSFSFLSRFSDGLIFVNDSVTSLYKFRGKHIVLRNCVRKRDFSPLPLDTDLEKAYQDRIIVVHIGSLREGYGEGTLLDSLAFIQNPAILFLILGGASDGFLEGIEREGYQEKVKVIDFLPLKEMLAYLSLADLGITLLQPRDKNMVFSLGRKFLEYVAAGIPVVVSDFPEYCALVDRYDLGLVINPEKPRDIAAAITRLAEDPELRGRLAENAARAFEIELNWEMESRKLFDLYDDLR